MWSGFPFHSGLIEPIYDSSYRYMHESTVTSGYVYVGLYDIYKFFHSLKLFTEDLVEEGQWGKQIIDWMMRRLDAITGRILHLAHA
jgi:hypothetical protein